MVAAAYDEKAAGITYPTQGFAGEVFWTLDSKGELNLWPVTPNGRTFWVIHTTGYVYPWQNYASSVKSVNVEKGVNFASHGYYLFIPTSNGYQPYEYQYSPTLVNAFKGFSNCEKFNLSGMIASSISATGMFEGCTSAKQITFGSGWSSYATFPQVADGQTAFKGWKVNGNAAAGLYKPGDVIPVNTNAFSAVFEGDEGSENENQNPVVTPDPPQTTTPNDNQLSVAVPITLDLSFGNAGLSKVRHLNRGSYGVENTGESAVKIADVEMLDPADGFDVDAIYQRGDSGALNYQEQPIDKNTVMLVYDDGTNYTYIGYKHPLSAARHLADAAIHDRYSFTDKHEVTIQPNEKLLISFNNSLCFIPTNKPLSAAAGNKSTLCKIAYTISAA